MRTFRRPGRLPSAGHDHREGHLRYVARAGAHGRSYLETKPFAAPATAELAGALRTFAHLVEALDLDLRAQVLDAGCGPGWLSEYLARCGCWVTGVDIAPDMVAIAKARLDAVGPIGPGLEAVAEFHAMPVREIPWRRRFDAVVLMDAMHHFDDEATTLRVLRESLVPGGRLFLHEGAWPRRGSADERHFLDEMRIHGTLESPFTPRHLVRSLRAAGFVDVELRAPIDRLFVRRRPLRALRHVVGRTLFPQSNTVVAQTPAEPGRAAGFAGVITPAGPARLAGGRRVHPLRVTNAGRRWWPATEGHPFPVGAVTVGPYVPLPGGGRQELERALLPGPLAPGESAAVEVAVPASAGAVAVDLVREGVGWFADIGGAAVTLPG